MHRLDDIDVIGSHVDDNVEFYYYGNYIENMFDRVFSDLSDINGMALAGRVKYELSYKKIIEKCNIENSMDVVYKLLNKHVKSQESIYFKDDHESIPSPDVLKIIELLNYLHDKRIPKKFVCGFLLLIVKFIYFPL